MSKGRCYRSETAAGRQVLGKDLRTARGRAIPRGRSEPGDDKQRAAALKERADNFAAIESCVAQGSFPNDFAPIMR